MILKFKEGEIYSPDSVEDLPKDCNQYFSDEEFQFWGKEHEYGTVRCIKSFSIEWKIKTL